ncbi:DUF6520 family protein [Pedobacter namyangjuensis]|uniref:DUF6520 family protein n=1 Tax=Pedobacter namyangjuensis TaxID=600626 RepID=UPI000DE1B03B|nr:DUF6520 family protein [Pedobacter namyangjuensis]
MKNLKKAGLGLAALVVAFGLAFSTSAFKAKKETRWFIYTQSDHPNNATDAKQPSNYTMLDAEELPPCEGEQDLCAIRADVVSGQPDISGSVATAIDNYFAPSPSLDPLYISEKN